MRESWRGDQLRKAQGQLYLFILIPLLAGADSIVFLIVEQKLYVADGENV
jgi:hypothetical protein